MLTVIDNWPCLSTRSACTTCAFGGELEVFKEAGPYNTKTSPSKTFFVFPVHMSNMEEETGLSSFFLEIEIFFVGYVWMSKLFS